MTPIDQPRIESAVRELLAAVGEDSERAGLESTPRRVAEAYAEFFSGADVDPVALVRASAVVSPEDRLGELVVVRDISFRSMCEHHLLPFTGVAHIAYIPGATIVGLGALPRLVDAIASRAQLQERLGEEIAEALDEGVEPRGVLVVLDAVHGCVTTRGPRQTASSTVTLASRGSLTDPASRAEAVALIGSSRREESA
ncbi:MULTISPECIES: GTP cyclohydrolase I FolE [unclassified Frigoribacterium]|uniref:GTP cyclohydrolase I FolE n=1 Tax=unclassified Frigoribacterium TaxID=2627005 RepID=UPI0006F9BD55|nr:MULTISPECIES: GTP cyclohydrolase I FolE [unclassified Frigoribacterium]KQO82959.1 GTP cyclohydrolase I [Frigoribacterium sp. Leaf263]KQR64347.1 GTP cyclohydrolase I [Frigoribacterium sp. Leaf172]